jgi:IS30 family transposase
MSHIQFSEKEIYAIEIYLEEKYKYSAIGRKLGRDASSVSRLVGKYKSQKT